MFNLKIRDITENATRNEEGELIYDKIKQPMKSGDMVMLDFEGIDLVTTAFINTSLVPLLELLDFQQIKKQLRIIKSNRHINDIIRSRLEFESHRIKVLA